MKIMPTKYADYTSPITELIEQMKEKDPGVETRQKEGWLLLWERPPLTERDMRERQKNIPYIVPQKGYVYSDPIMNKDTIKKADSFK